MAIKEIVGSVVAVFVAIYMLFFMIPVTKTTYNLELSHLNTTSSLMQSILPITNGWWTIFPILILFIAGWTIWQNASRYFGFDY